MDALFSTPLRLCRGDKVDNLEEEEEEEEGYIAFVHVTRRLELTSRQMGTH